jgi:hypothetical protein
MDNTPTKFEGVECPEWMKNMLDKMIKIADGTRSFINPDRYFKSLYGKYMLEKMRFRATEPYEPSYPKFLEYAECHIIYTMYKKICNNLLSKGILSQSKQLNNIQYIGPNDILFIQCPSFFSSYHFIVAVVNSSRENVNIYQSYGNKPLYNITINLPEFKQHLQNMQNLKYYTKEHALSMIKDFEKRVYGNDFNNMVKSQMTDNIDSDDDIAYEEMIDHLYDRYIMMQEIPFRIDLYKLIKYDLSYQQKENKKINIVFKLF